MAETRTATLPLFHRACLGERVERTPIWIMRQAGRYLPEYREVRSKVSFLELCRTPDLAAEVSLQPYRRFDPDGVIFFSDILVPVAAMGARVEFGDAGPILPEPVRSAADVKRLHAFDPSTQIGFTGEILATLRREVGDRAAVLGFAGAPWTLASYLVEGGGSSPSRDQADDGARPRDSPAPSISRRRRRGRPLQMNGARAGSLRHLGGDMTARDYREWPSRRSVGCAIRAARRPVILSSTVAHLLEAMAESGADTLSIDWRVPLSEARRRVPRLSLQGNLDPGILLGPAGDVARRTRDLLAETGGRAHIVNLGHGVLPQTPIESAQAFFDAAREVPAEHAVRSQLSALSS